MDVRHRRRTSILILLESTEKTCWERSKIVGISISTVGRVLKIPKKQSFLPRNEKANVDGKEKRPPETMPT